MNKIEGTGNKHIGDFHNGNIDLNLDDLDDEKKLSRYDIELNNNYAAMIGMLRLCCRSLHH